MDKKEFESPLKKHFDAFDVEHFDWTANDYKAHAIKQQVNLNAKLIEDWKWRYKVGQNVITSAHGQQGSGKSLFLGGCSLLCASIFGKPFYDAENHTILKRHLSFDSETMDSQLDNAQACETYLNDEHRKMKVGIMANMIEASLEEKEDQLRKKQINMHFASPDLEDHQHFFVFEIKHIYYPHIVVAMLKTRRYTDTNEFVWRGFISMKIPPQSYLDQYDPLKDLHLDKLKSKMGNTLDDLGYYVDKIFNESQEKLVTKSREGFSKPVNYELMYSVVIDKIGTRRFTTTGYRMLQARLKQKILAFYQEDNDKLEMSLKNESDKSKQENKRKFDLQMEEAQKKRDLKLKLLEMQLEEDKRKNDLKARSIEIKELEHKRKVKKVVQDV